MVVTMSKKVVLLGSQWVDEGKVKIVDLLTERADAVVLFLDHGPPEQHGAGAPIFLRFYHDLLSRSGRLRVRHFNGGSLQEWLGWDRPICGNCRIFVTHPDGILHDREWVCEESCKHPGFDHKMDLSALLLDSGSLLHRVRLHRRVSPEHTLSDPAYSRAAVSEPLCH